MDIQRKLKSRRRPFLIPALLIGGLVLVTAALSQLEPASPSVKRSMLSFDTVKRGLLVRDVRGPGNLVPEQIRYITALTPGRVERVFVRPGVTVDSSTVLMELSNPDVHIQALQAEQQLTGA
jgi:HlyD family secretion protein